MVFKPTYLYIKRHNLTGLLYFGKTINDPLKYPGSGLHWTRHIKKHGKDVSTIWFEQFVSKEDLVEFATFFSDYIDIVDLKSWANIRIENGLDGQIPGFQFSPETLLKMAESRLNRKSWNYGRKGALCHNYGRRKFKEPKIKSTKKEQIDKMAKSRTKIYDITCPDGTVLKNLSLRDFSILKGFNENSVRASRYQMGSYKGFVFN